VWSAGRGGYVFALQWKLTRSCKQWCTERKHPNSVVFDLAIKKERCSNLTNPQQEQEENQTLKLLHALWESCLTDFLRRVVEKNLPGTKKNTCDHIEHHCKPNLQTNAPVQSDRSLSKQAHNQAKKTLTIGEKVEKSEKSYPFLLSEESMKKFWMTSAMEKAPLHGRMQTWGTNLEKPSKHISKVHSKRTHLPWAPTAHQAKHKKSPMTNWHAIVVVLSL
jgi:hypothetical protein